MMSSAKPGDWVVVTQIADRDTEAAARQWAEHLVGVGGVLLSVRGNSWARVRLDEAVDLRKIWRISLLDLEPWVRPSVVVPYAAVLYCGLTGDRGRVLHALADCPRAVGLFPTLCGVTARAVWRRGQAREPLPWSGTFPHACLQCALVAPMARARGPDLSV
jgi:hypothetical protein